MQNPENLVPAQTIEQTETTIQEPLKENFLSLETAADQTLWLTGINPLRNEIPLSEYNLKRKIDGRKNRYLKKLHSQNITQASLNECDNYWKKQNTDNPMNQWITSTQIFIDHYADHESKTNFLKKLVNTENKELQDIKITPMTIYNTFIGQGQRKLEYFAERVIEASQNNPVEIQTNLDIIKELTNIYGEEYCNKIALNLTYAIFNAQTDSKELSKATRTQLLKKQYDTALWEKFEEHTNEWKTKQAGKTPEAINKTNEKPTQIFPDQATSSSTTTKPQTNTILPAPLIGQNDQETEDSPPPPAPPLQPDP